MVHVAKPSKRLLMLDFSKPDQTLWRLVYFSYLKFFVPLLNLVFYQNTGAYTYILKSLKHYPTQHNMTAQIRELNLTNVHIENLLNKTISINCKEKTKQKNKIIKYCS